MARSKEAEYECHKKLRRFKLEFGYDRRFRIDLNPIVTVVSAGLLWGVVIWCITQPDEVQLISCFDFASLNVVELLFLSSFDFMF